MQTTAYKSKFSFQRKSHISKNGYCKNDITIHKNDLSFKLGKERRKRKWEIDRERNVNYKRIWILFGGIPESGTLTTNHITVDENNNLNCLYTQKKFPETT